MAQDRRGADIPRQYDPSETAATQNRFLNARDVLRYGFDPGSDDAAALQLSGTEDR